MGEPGGSTYEARIAAKARAITEADPVAPHPDAPIVMGMRHALAWEARVREATALEVAASRMDGYAALALWQPKKPCNVGSVMRSAICFGAAAVYLCGNPLRFKEGALRKLSTDTVKGWRHVPLLLSPAVPEAVGAERIAVEISEGAVNLKDFVHPESATYVFGPEDGSVPAAVADTCRYKVVIPTRFCLNLAMAVSIVLYDRTIKRWRE